MSAVGGGGAAFVPRGRPVLRFVAAMAALALAAAALWWSGLAAPRLELTAANDSSAHRGNPARGTLRMSIANNGPFAVDVLAIRWMDDRIHLIEISLDGEDPGRAQVVLSPHESADLRLDYETEVGCERTDLAENGVVVRVRTRLGIERTLRLRPQGPVLSAFACLPFSDAGGRATDE